MRTPPFAKAQSDFQMGMVLYLAKVVVYLDIEKTMEMTITSLPGPPAGGCPEGSHNAW